MTKIRWLINISWFNQVQGSRSCGSPDYNRFMLLGFFQAFLFTSEALKHHNFLRNASESVGRIPRILRIMRFHKIFDDTWFMNRSNSGIMNRHIFFVLAIFWNGESEPKKISVKVKVSCLPAETPTQYFKNRLSIFSSQEICSGLKWILKFNNLSFSKSSFTNGIQKSRNSSYLWSNFPIYFSCVGGNSFDLWELILV